MKIWTFAESEDGSFLPSEGFVSEGKVNRAVALGYFDGVHAGHRAILDKLCYEARCRKLSATVHTFSSLPKSKKDNLPSDKPTVLTTVKEKCAYFSIAGADETVLFPFSERLSEMTPENFLTVCLKDILCARVIVAGEDYRFGKDRMGDISLLRAWGEKNDVLVFAVPPLCHEGQPISSSRIRLLIQNGDIHQADVLLGYPISYQGIVQVGRQLGRTLGFPTANIPVEDDKVVPAFGVYASLMHTNSGLYPSITSVGVRPTVNASQMGVLMETTMFDREMDLYGQPIRVYLLKQIREERRFSDVGMLKEQVFRDMQKVRLYHEGHSYDYSNLLPGVV